MGCNSSEYGTHRCVRCDSEVNDSDDSVDKAKIAELETEIAILQQECIELIADDDTGGVASIRRALKAEGELRVALLERDDWKAVYLYMKKSRNKVIAERDEARAFILDQVSEKRLHGSNPTLLTKALKLGFLPEHLVKLLDGSEVEESELQRVRRQLDEARAQIADLEYAVGSTGH